MSQAADASARYLIKTDRGVRGPFTKADLQALVDSGKVPLWLRLHDLVERRAVAVAELLGPASGQAPAMPARVGIVRGLRRRVSLTVVGSVLFVLAAVGALLAAHHLRAAAPATTGSEEDPVEHAAQAEFSQHVAPFLAANCVSCHGAERQKAGVRLDLLSADPADQSAVAICKRALEQLQSGAMPPEERSRPQAGEQARVTAWMHGQLARNARIWPEPPLRRLNREEYANAVADLLGVRDDLREMLPDELGGSEGFTNEAELLRISTRQVEAYLKAATCAAAAVITPPPCQVIQVRIEDSDPMRTDPEKKSHWDRIPRLLNNIELNPVAIARGDLLIFNQLAGYHFLPVTLSAAGTYRLRMRAIALLRGRPPARARVTFTDVSGMDAWSAGVTASMRPFVVRNVAAQFADEPAVITALGQVPADLPPERIKEVDPVLAEMYATAKPQIVFENTAAAKVDIWLKNTRPVPQLVQEQARAQSTVIEGLGRLPAGQIKLYLDAEGVAPDRMMIVHGGLELEGPLPPTCVDERLTSVLAHSDTAGYVEWLAKIMTTAYRRQVTTSEAGSWFGRFHGSGPTARPFVDAARNALTAVLCSPEFIAVLEKPRMEPRQPRPLDSGELARRLSLFLWRGLPDQELSHAVAMGLTETALRTQFERMLGDRRLARFIHEFDDGWLGLRDFDAVLPDPKMFPSAQGDHLHESLRREPDEFLAHLIAEDRSILDLLRSSYVVVNDRLAEYYGLGQPAAGGADEFRVVRFPEQSLLELGTWSGIGPFTAASAPAAFATPYPPEQGVDLKATYKDGALHWVERPDWTDGVPHDLTGENCAWYLTRTVNSSVAQDVTLSLGSDDGIKVWMDGVELLSKEVYRGVAPDQDSVSVHLQPGEHRLLMKIHNGGGGYGFFFRVVGLNESTRRGGVLGMGAVLMQTSQSTRTSPTRRGVWFLENLLGTKPPPPPPSAKAVLAHIEATVTGQPSRRQILELHRHDPTCASCHARFDPLGFALENYGPDGLWRTNELLQIHVDGVYKGTAPGAPIDPSGTLPDGRTFTDIDGLKRLLVAEPAPFVRAFAKKLLAFAVGRRLGPQDEPSIDGIVSAAVAGKYRIRAVLAAVIASESFQRH
jgi:cytochrome c553